MNTDIELLSCTFDNGNKSCIATIYNLYPVLVYLDLLKPKDIPLTHSACWIRDYRTGRCISTFNKLVKKLECGRYGLRVSFFSYDSLGGFGDLIKLARLAKLPEITHESFAPFHLTVYTIWWDNKTPQLSQSNINQNPVAIERLFKRIGTVYKAYYFTADDESYSEDHETYN